MGDPAMSISIEDIHARRDNMRRELDTFLMNANAKAAELRGRLAELDHLLNALTTPPDEQANADGAVG